MGITGRTRCALLPFAAVLMGAAAPGSASAPRAPIADQTSRGPDWVLLAVAGIALVVGRTVVQRRHKRDSKTPR